MSIWEKEQIETEILNILKLSDKRGDHFEEPFFTPYQIVIELKKRCPDKVKRINLEIGGKNSKAGFSLAQYIARELSGRIKNDEIKNIKISTLSNLNLQEIVFEGNVKSSLTGTNKAVSIFRLEKSTHELK